MEPHGSVHLHAALDVISSLKEHPITVGLKPELGPTSPVEPVRNVAVKSVVQGPAPLTLFSIDSTDALHFPQLVRLRLSACLPVCMSASLSLSVSLCRPFSLSLVLSVCFCRLRFFLRLELMASQQAFIVPYM